MSKFQLTSEGFTHDSDIPEKYTCDGENISPQLTIRNVPEGTKSLALIVDDPDSPSGHFTHWILYNLGPQTATIPEGKVPTEAREGINSFRNHGFGGPCPHQGKHRYVFSLFALDQLLELAGPELKDIEAAMQGHILDQTQLIGQYQRK